ncbi:MAG: 4-hydroxy-tetrahydrodipicolinate synthase [Myxococcales bacterium]|nr:4-hydroxy-tetrahydrodipicolinate synthase [Myxococcales bacterium]
MFRGVYTALITPFTPDGSLDVPALERLIERQVAAGVHGIVPCGTTGEAATLTDEERAVVFRAAVTAAKGRCKVMAGVGTNDTRRAAEMAKQARMTGVDGLLVVTPYYNKPTQEGLYQHNRTISEAVPGLPLTLYNVPGRTSVSLAADTIDRLADLPDIVAIKEATADLTFDGELITRLGDRMDVISGDDPTALALWAIGGQGVISVTSNLLPEKFVAMWAAFQANDLAGARALHHELFPLFQGLFWETNPVPVKSLVAWHTGLCGDHVRLPLASLQPNTVARLKGLCDRMGVALPHAPT